MKFYKNNAYPEVSLHDKAFKFVKKTNEIKFVFPEGVDIVSKDDIKTVGAEIIIKNPKIDDFKITSVKPLNIFGYHRMISRDVTIGEFERIFDKFQLEIFDEYYAYNSFIWRCSFKPYDKKMHKKYYNIEIEGYTESPLEYYIEE